MSAPVAAMSNSVRSIVVTGRPSRRVISSSARLVGVAALSCDRQVDRHHGCSQPDWHQRTRMAERGVFSAGEQRPNQPSSHRERAEGIHALVDDLIAPGPHSMVDRLLAKPRGEQLPALRNAFLSLEEEFDVTLPSHMEGSVTFNLLWLYARA
jgi:hypothetical protein